MQNQLQTRIANGIGHYHRAKPEDDVDLVTTVRDMLIASGCHQNIERTYDQNRFIVEAVDKSSDVQRFLLNRYWSQQLMSCSKVSIEEKYCLIPNGEISEWLALFRTKILPFAIANNLPIVI